MTSLGLPLPHCSPIQHPLPSQPLAAYFSTRSTSVIVFSSPHPATSLQTVHAPQDPTARPQRYNTANNTSPAHTPHLQTLLTSHAHKLHYTPHTTHHTHTTPHHTHTPNTPHTHHTHTPRGGLQAVHDSPVWAGTHSSPSPIDSGKHITMHCIDLTVCTPTHTAGTGRHSLLPSPMSLVPECIID